MMSEAEYKGAAFDPKNYRMLSILPPADEDEAYCVRHDMAMSEVQLNLKHNDAVYKMSDGFTAYSCVGCSHELGKNEDNPHPKTIFKWYVEKAFDKWDKGEAYGDWFEYLCEAEDYEEE